MRAATHPQSSSSLPATQRAAPPVQVGTRLLRLPAVTARVGMKRTSVYALIKRGTFPRPVKIGKASAWLDHEITLWIETLSKERDAEKRAR